MTDSKPWLGGGGGGGDVTTAELTDAINSAVNSVTTSITSETGARQAEDISLDGRLSALESGGGGSSAIESLYVARIAASPGVRPGRTVYADFADQDQVNAMFDISNFTFGTDASDGGRAVLVPPSSGFDGVVSQRCLTKAAIGMFRNVEVRSRFRTTAGMHSSTIVENVARYLSENNFMWARQSWNPADPHQEIGRASKPGGSLSSGAQASASGTVDVTDTHIWKQAFRVWEDIVSYKVWEDGTPEPEWQIQARLGASGGTRTDIGLAGARFQTVNDAGVVLSELSITELVDCTENLLINPDFLLQGAGNGSTDGWSSGTLGWALPAVGANSKVEWTNVVDASGITRRFLHLKRPTNGDPLLPNVVQNVYRRTELLGDDRVGRNQQLLDARCLEVAVTSKANNLAHAAGNTFLGIAVDCYYFDESTGESNVGHAGYFKVLGPNRLDSAGDQVGDGTDGLGTWDWRRDRVHLELVGTTAPPNRIDFAVVMHDVDVTGELWMGDFEMRAVA